MQTILNNKSNNKVKGRQRQQSRHKWNLPNLISDIRTGWVVPCFHSACEQKQWNMCSKVLIYLNRYPKISCDTVMVKLLKVKAMPV